MGADAMQCSDTIGRDSLQADLEPFRYKNKVEILTLGIVDDIITITESGYKTSRMNFFMLMGGV